MYGFKNGVRDALHFPVIVSVEVYFIRAMKSWLVLYFTNSRSFNARVAIVLSIVMAERRFVITSLKLFVLDPTTANR